MVYEARCWGGPLDGQWFTAPSPSIRVARLRELKPLAIGPDDKITWVEDEYRLEKFVVEGERYWAWVVTAPLERREAIMDTIEKGARVVLFMCGRLR